MEQVDFGARSGFKVAPMSIGAMRLPADLDEPVKLIRYAIDAGMVYIDTCRCYGDSEIKVGHALKDGYREKVILSTKWSSWIVKIEEDDAPTADCVRRRMEESMERLQVDYLDFYQVWNITSRETYEQSIAKGGPLEAILKAKDEGLVGHTGFTTHDTPENLLSYMEEIDWCEIMLLTNNLLNSAYQPVLKAAHDRGIGTIVMNPVGGGRLAEPSAVLDELAAKIGVASVPEMALRYLLADPSITTTIVGIGKKSDVDEAVAAAETGGLDAEQMAAVEGFMRSVERQNAGFCTGCKYCMPCSEKIDIPGVMSAIYDDRYWGFTDAARERYAKLEGPKADQCTDCGECEKKCTQQLKIAKEMKYARRRFRAAGGPVG